MPSLRRTFSSPPARRAPYYYPSALSSSALQTRPAPHQPRRSSGSDVANRRVLADIDWWIVQDGQRDIYDASTGGRTFTDASENDSDVEPRATPAPAEGVDALLSAWQPTPSVAVTSPERLPVPYFGDITMEGGIGVGSSELLSPLAQFADLTLAPSTLMHHRFTHSYSASDDSFSSIDSTPESISFALLATPPQPTIGLMDDAFISSNTAFISPARPTRSGTSFDMARSVSYSTVEDEVAGLQDDQEFIIKDPFADFTLCALMLAPPPFFSATQLDVDDLFF